MFYNIIDVSRYQGKIDWNKVKKTGVEGAMLKTVSTNSHFGGIYIDPTFEYNYAECKRLGIPVGCYYYTYASDKNYADRELAMFKKAIEGKSFELPLCIDVEDNTLRPLSKADLTVLVEYAAQKIQSWHAYVFIYTYYAYAHGEIDFNKLKDYDFWVADYRGKRPTSPVHGMWQYSSKGSVNGITGNVDMNYAYRDYPTIIKNAGLNNFEKNKIEWDNRLNDKIYRSIKGNNQYFKSANVNDVAGYLPQGDYKIKSASKEKIDGFDWVIIEVKGKDYYAVILEDRCEIYNPNNCEEIKAENEKMKNEIQELKDETTKLHGALYSIRETINTILK